MACNDSLLKEAAKALEALRKSQQRARRREHLPPGLQQELAMLTLLRADHGCILFYLMRTMTRRAGVRVQGDMTTERLQALVVRVTGQMPDFVKILATVSRVLASRADFDGALTLTDDLPRGH